PGNEQDDAGSLLIEQPAEPEDDTALVLAQDAHRRSSEGQPQQQKHDHDDNDDCDDHGFSSHSSALRTRKVKPLTRSTTTLSPSCSLAPSWIGLGSARQSAPSRKTCASDAPPERTTPTCPTSASPPVRGRARNEGTSRCLASTSRLPAPT